MLLLFINSEIIFIENVQKSIWQSLQIIWGPIATSRLRTTGIENGFQVDFEWHLRNGKVDNGRILLHKEVVLGESFDAEDEIWRQFGQLEFFEKILFVGFVFLK